MSDAPQLWTIIRRRNGREIELSGALLEVTRPDGMAVVAINAAEWKGETAGADLWLRHERDYVDLHRVKTTDVTRVVRYFVEVKAP